jgi:hypothetical protein
VYDYEDVLHIQAEGKGCDTQGEGVKKITLLEPMGRNEQKNDPFRRYSGFCHRRKWSSVMSIRLQSPDVR